MASTPGEEKPSANNVPVMEIRVKEIIDLTYFWAQIGTAEQLNDFEEKIAVMSLWCENSSVGCCASSTGLKMEKIVAIGEKGKCWVRGRITRIVSDEEVEVFYVDTGATGSVNVREICAVCPPVMLDIPQQALHCILDGLKQLASSEEWSDEAHSLFKDLVALPTKAIIHNVLQGQRVCLSIFVPYEGIYTSVGEILRQKNLAKYKSPGPLTLDLPVPPAQQQEKHVLPPTLVLENYSHSVQDGSDDVTTNPLSSNKAAGQQQGSSEEIIFDKENDSSLDFGGEDGEVFAVEEVENDSTKCSDVGDGARMPKEVPTPLTPEDSPADTACGDSVSKWKSGPEHLFRPFVPQTATLEDALSTAKSTKTRTPQGTKEKDSLGTRTDMGKPGKSGFLPRSTAAEDTVKAKVRSEFEEQYLTDLLGDSSSLSDGDWQDEKLLPTISSVCSANPSKPSSWTTLGNTPHPMSKKPRSLLGPPFHTDNLQQQERSPPQGQKGRGHLPYQEGKHWRSQERGKSRGGKRGRGRGSKHFGTGFESHNSSSSWRHSTPYGPGHSVFTDAMPPRYQQEMPPRHQQDMPPRHQQDMPPRQQQEMPPRHQQEMPPRHQQDMPPRHQQEIPQHIAPLSPVHSGATPLRRDTSSVPVEMSYSDQLLRMNRQEVEDEMKWNTWKLEKGVERVLQSLNAASVENFGREVDKLLGNANSVNLLQLPNCAPPLEVVVKAVVSMGVSEGLNRHLLTRALVQLLEGPLGDQAIQVLQKVLDTMAHEILNCSMDEGKKKCHNFCQLLVTGTTMNVLREISVGVVKECFVAWTKQLESFLPESEKLELTCFSCLLDSVYQDLLPYKNILIELVEGPIKESILRKNSSRDLREAWLLETYKIMKCVYQTTSGGGGSTAFGRLHENVAQELRQHQKEVESQQHPLAASQLEPKHIGLELKQYVDDATTPEVVRGPLHAVHAHSQGQSNRSQQQRVAVDYPPRLALVHNKLAYPSKSEMLPVPSYPAGLTDSNAPTTPPSVGMVGSYASNSLQTPVLQSSGGAVGSYASNSPRAPVLQSSGAVGSYASNSPRTPVLQSSGAVGSYASNSPRAPVLQSSGAVGSYASNSPRTPISTPSQSAIVMDSYVTRSVNKRDSYPLVSSHSAGFVEGYTAPPLPLPSPSVGNSYAQVTQMLESLQLTEVLPKFKDALIKDSVLECEVEVVKDCLKEAGVPSGAVVQITRYLVQGESNHPHQQQHSQSPLQQHHGFHYPLVERPREPDPERTNFGLPSTGQRIVNTTLANSPEESRFSSNTTPAAAGPSAPPGMEGSARRPGGFGSISCVICGGSDHATYTCTRTDKRFVHM